jgi:hypothetical protein
LQHDILETVSPGSILKPSTKTALVAENGTVAAVNSTETKAATVAADLVELPPAPLPSPPTMTARTNKSWAIRTRAELKRRSEGATDADGDTNAIDSSPINTAFTNSRVKRIKTNNADPILSPLDASTGYKAALSLSPYRAFSA